MKNIQPGDRPKLIALVVGVLVLFAVAAWQFVNYGAAQDQMIAAAKQTKDKARSKAGTIGAVARNPAPSAAPTVTPAIPALPGVTAPTGAKAVVAVPNRTATSGVVPLVVPSPAFDPATLGPPIGGKDPFAEVRIASDAMAAKLITAIAPRTPAVNRRWSPPLISTVGLTPVFRELTGQHGLDPLLLPPPEPPVVVVTGIILGENAGTGSRTTQSVAILRGGALKGSGGRQFVSVGDSVGNGFSVTAVTIGGVDLQNGTHHVNLKIGNKP